MEKVRIHDPESGELVGRDGVVFAFFTSGGYDRIASSVVSLYEAWREMTEESLQWAVVGANATRYADYGGALQDRICDYLEPSKATQRRYVQLEVCGGDSQNCPAVRFLVSGARDPDALECSLVELRFPSDWPDSEGGWDRVSALALRISEMLPYDSGYVSPALIQGPEHARALELAGAALLPLATRHHGYDLAANDWTRRILGQRIRGARWLTFLSAQHVARLGGREALSKTLEPPIDVVHGNRGTMVRANEQPEMGDVNRASFADQLGRVATVLEPVTLFGDYQSFQGFIVDDDEDHERRLDRWERRLFLAQAQPRAAGIR